MLEGVRTRATTVQISVKVPQKTKNRNITWPSHTALEHTVLEHYYTNFYNSEYLQNCHMTSFTSYSLNHHGTEMLAHPFLQLRCSQEMKMKPAWRPSHRRIENVTHIHSDASCSHKETKIMTFAGQRVATGNNFVKRTKPDSRDTNAACFLSHEEPSFTTVPELMYMGHIELE